MSQGSYLTAKEAAEALDISLQTLYAYVSRGLIRSEVANKQQRTHRYLREDIQKLKERKEQRQTPEQMVENALHWGAPLLESAITLIAGDRFYYRGRDALQLARQASVEAVASLIWAGEADLAAVIPGLFEAEAAPLSPRLQQINQSLTDLPAVERFQTLLPLAAAEDLAAYDLRAAAVAQTGVRILRLLAILAAGPAAAGHNLAELLQQGWTPDFPQAASLISAALILCADHELNVSSFTARCVASAGATPYEVVMAGLAALQGVKHGRNTEQVEAFLREVETLAQAQRVIAGRLKRGEALPGFRHPLYPQGDPRGLALLAWTAELYPEAPAVVLGREVAEQAFNLLGERPNIDFSLVILAKALNLPPGGPLALFALGRTIGWIGHAIEQYQIDRIVRPRARYVGALPQEAAS
jgi:citrate synthase